VKVSSRSKQFQDILCQRSPQVAAIPIKGGHFLEILPANAVKCKLSNVSIQRSESLQYIKRDSSTWWHQSQLLVGNLVHTTRRARLCKGHAVDRVYGGDGMARNQTSEEAEDGIEHLPLHLSLSS
jgi:hypothetical protein